MKTKRNKMDTKSWKDIKDTVYGKKGTERRDELERGLNLLKSVCFYETQEKKKT